MKSESSDADNTVDKKVMSLRELRDDETDEGNVTVDQLYNELQSDGPAEGGSGVRLAPDQRSEVLLDHVVETLFGEARFNFDDDVVKENLNEVLLLLVAHRTSDTHGKTLMSDLATIFDTHLSPGTVYPQLHELADDDLLEVQELVRTKEYRIRDEDAFVDEVRTAIEQHLALGFYMQAALNDYLD